MVDFWFKSFSSVEILTSSPQKQQKPANSNLRAHETLEFQVIWGREELNDSVDDLSHSFDECWQSEGSLFTLVDGIRGGRMNRVWGVFGLKMKPENKLGCVSSSQINSKMVQQSTQFQEFLGLFISHKRI